MVVSQPFVILIKEKQDQLGHIAPKHASDFNYRSLGMECPLINAEIIES